MLALLNIKSSVHPSVHLTALPISTQSQTTLLRQSPRHQPQPSIFVFMCHWLSVLFPGCWARAYGHTGIAEPKRTSGDGSCPFLPSSAPQPTSSFLPVPEPDTTEQQLRLFCGQFLSLCLKFIDSHTPMYESAWTLIAKWYSFHHMYYSLCVCTCVCVWHVWVCAGVACMWTTDRTFENQFFPSTM